MTHEKKILLKRLLREFKTQLNQSIVEDMQASVTNYSFKDGINIKIKLNDIDIKLDLPNWAVKKHEQYDQLGGMNIKNMTEAEKAKLKELHKWSSEYISSLSRATDKTLKIFKDNVDEHIKKQIKIFDALVK